MKLLFIYLTLAMSLTHVTFSQIKAETYISDHYGVKIDHLSNWEEHGLNNDSSVVTFKNNSIPDESLTIKQPIKIKHNLTSYIKLLSMSLSDFGINPYTEDVILNGQLAKRVIYSFKRGEKEYYSSTWYVIHEAKLYQLVHTNSNHAASQASDLVNTMIDSFKII